MAVSPNPTPAPVDPLLDATEWLHALDHARRAHRGPGARLRAVRRQAEAVRERLLDAPPVRFYGSSDLRRVPYPTRYGLRDACKVPTPFVHILNRVFVVQFDVPGEGTKTLLVSPSDIEANGETPFFKRLGERFGPLSGVGEQLLSPPIRDVETALAGYGISPEQVDYITYDHLHTQDLRKWLGDARTGSKGVLPNAKLLVMRQEWESALDLAPPQMDWYCPNGLDGIDPERVVLLDGSTLLGQSVALIATPGHTEGNHSIVVRAPEGLFVTSENGIGPDSFAPEHSRIPGLKAYSEATGMEVVLNGNTLEGALDQYLSMVVEKTLAGRSARHPDFPNVASSSELTSYFLFPGIAPTFQLGEVTLGRPVRLVDPATEPSDEAGSR